MSRIPKNMAILVAAAILPMTIYGQAPKPFVCMRAFGQKEWSLILKGLDADKKKLMIEDKAARMHQVDHLKELLALSCEAVGRKLHLEEANKTELNTIRSEIFAISYDKKVSKAGAVPFSRVTDAQVAGFYETPGNVADFERFLKAKLDLLNRGEGGDPVTAEERDQAKDFFAKIRISEKESITSGVAAREPFRSDVDLKVRLQQAQFLARIVAEALAQDLSVSDGEVTRYIAAHPEFDSSAKRELAMKVLTRAKSGEDFAALANEFSEDPGNTTADGKKNGGLYADVPTGRMVPPFEKASLSLEPGQVYPTLVETDFGYHIVKLEKKTADADGYKYDVRHVLISTMYRDPADPESKGMPITMVVRARLEGEKERAVLDRIIASNRVTVEDYVVPAPPKKRAVVRKRR